MLTRTQLEWIFVLTVVVLAGLIGYFVLTPDTSTTAVLALALGSAVVGSVGISAIRRWYRPTS